MLVIISPAKNFNLKPQNQSKEYTIPEFLKQTQVLVEKMKKLDPHEISALLKINPDLAFLTFTRYQNWNWSQDQKTSKQAILTFVGEVFRGINAGLYSEKELLYAQNHLRILSGLYGVIRPLDLIQPYRLEMGTHLNNKKGNNLYKFWGNSITNSINNLLTENNIQTIINLASAEYFKVINNKIINAKIISPIFIESKRDENKVIVIYTKKARGLMSSFIIKNQIKNPEELKHFDLNGYSFMEKLSDETKWTFMR